tara:strand:- start:1166 stop:1405 length:240 start_codon:yes stop_codon:yes gene_type:complete
MAGEDTDSTTLRITLRDVYREQQEMKSLLEKLANSLPNTEDKLTDHEIRLRKLEMRVGWAVGSFGLLAALAPFFAKIIP